MVNLMSGVFVFTDCRRNIIFALTKVTGLLFISIKILMMNCW